LLCATTFGTTSRSIAHSSLARIRFVSKADDS
jgi:hypothetical protein